MKHYIYLLTFIVSAALASCNSDSDPVPSLPSDACYDFVTIADIASNSTTFTLRKSDDSPLITYNTAYSFASDSSFYVGERLIIAYDRTNGAEPYTNGAITLYGYRTLDCTNQNLVLEDKSNANNWMSDQVKTVSLTRTGQYINLQCLLYARKAEKPKELILAADSATINEGYPNLYVIYTPQTPGDNYFTGYASWDISKVWYLESCKGVKITVQTPDGLRTTTFDKVCEITPIN